jgi:hypothetical protein
MRFVNISIIHQNSVILIEYGHCIGQQEMRDEVVGAERICV